MRKKCKGLTGLILALSIVLLTACQKAEPEVTENESSPSQAVQEEGNADTVSEGEKIKLVMWGWSEDRIINASDDFAKLYPNIEIEFVPVQAADYAQKVQTTIASGSQLPDVVWMDIDLRGKMYQMDAWENLEAAPYNYDRTLTPDWLYPSLEDKEGNICSIPWDMGIAGLAYRKDLAKEYLGTDDPVELEDMLSDWDAFIEKGIEVKEKSNGNVKMFSALDEVMTLVSKQNAVPFVEEGKANVEGTLGRAIDVGIQMRDNDLVGKLDMWSPAWNADFSMDNAIFNLCAEWAPSTVIGPNDSEGTDRWGLMVPPEGCVNQGGTSMAIPKTARNKEAAWNFINWFLLSEEGAKVNKEENEATIHITTLAKDNPSYYSGTSFLFGDADIGEFYYTKAFPTIELRPLGVYDLELMSTTTLVAKAIMQDKSLDYETAMEKAAVEVESIIQ